MTRKEIPFDHIPRTTASEKFDARDAKKQFGRPIGSRARVLTPQEAIAMGHRAQEAVATQLPPTAEKTDG